MLYTADNHAELDVLMLFKSSTSLEGIKIHKTAAEHAHLLYDMLHAHSVE